MLQYPGFRAGNGSALVERMRVTHSTIVLTVITALLTQARPSAGANEGVAAERIGGRP